MHKDQFYSQRTLAIFPTSLLHLIRSRTMSSNYDIAQDNKSATCCNIGSVDGGKKEGTTEV